MNKLIVIAEKFIGLTEKGKFELMDYYNEHCYPLVKRKYRIQRSDAWCAMFVSVVAKMSKMPMSAFPYEVSVFQQMLWAKERGVFTNDYRKVKIGDLVIFDWNYDGTPDHIGFVCYINSINITTIEGNFRGTVGHRTFKTESMGIRGYILL